MLRAKNYLNRPMFHGVIQKITLAQFFSETRCTYFRGRKPHLKEKNMFSLNNYVSKT